VKNTGFDPEADERLHWKPKPENRRVPLAQTEKQTLEDQLDWKEIDGKKSPKTCTHDEKLKTKPYRPDPKREQTKEPNSTTQDPK
jgi:hypothetical protein